MIVAKFAQRSSDGLEDSIDLAGSLEAIRTLGTSHDMTRTLPSFPQMTGILGQLCIEIPFLTPEAWGERRRLRSSR
jgi:hypothetical protein